MEPVFLDLAKSELFIWQFDSTFAPTWFCQLNLFSCVTSQVPLLPNGHKGRTSLTGWIHRYWTLKASRMTNDGHHSQPIVLLNQSLCTERLHTLSSNNSSITKTITSSMSPASQFQYQNLLLLHILPLGAGLHRVHPTTTQAI